MKRRASYGFTRTDLLALATVLLGLSVLTLVSLADGRIQNSAIVCLNNHRRLVQSWLLYADVLSQVERALMRQQQRVTEVPNRADQ